MRINICGGSGLGKTRTAAWIFAELKKHHYSVEYIEEYVKSWAVQKREIKMFDQNYIFAKQQHYEYRFLSRGIKNIVTGSPTILQPLYAELLMGKEYAKPLQMLEEIYEEKFPSFNIVLHREGEFNPEGRYEGSHEDASKIDDMVLQRLTEKNRDFVLLERNDEAGIMSHVLEKVDI
jgi:nicotinamide riboside kinase